MILFIIGALLVLFGIAWLVFGPSTYESTYDGDISIKWIGAAAALLGLVLALLSCFSVVGTRNVGVETVFGKPTGENHQAGLVFKAPWANITDIDATIQNDEYTKDRCIKVKIADGGTACVWLTDRWRINPDGADKVFMDYRKSDKDITDSVRSALVSTNIKASLNEVFGAYDPLDGAEIKPDMTAEEIANIKIALPDPMEFNKLVQENLENKIKGLGDLIDIQSITISFIELPEKTENRINQINAKALDTKLALQDIAIKKAQADGNKELAKSLQDPNVLVSRCLDALASGDIKAPAGFNCWPGAGGSVVIPGSK